MESSPKYKVDSIVLIDDNEVDNMVNQRILEAAQFAKNVYVYTSGKSALEFLKNLDRNPDFPQEWIPKLIFLDINMPIMDGFSFIEALDKLSPRIHKQMRVILLSQSSNPQVINQAKKNSLVKDYLVKPLNAEMVQKLAV